MMRLRSRAMNGAPNAVVVRRFFVVARAQRPRLDELIEFTTFATNYAKPLQIAEIFRLQFDDDRGIVTAVAERSALSPTHGIVMELTDREALKTFLIDRSKPIAMYRGNADPFAFLIEFTGQRAGQSCSVITRDLLQGVRIDAEQVPFILATLLTDGKSIAVRAGDQSQPSAVCALVLCNVSAVMLTRSRKHQRISLRINHGSAQTVVHFHSAA